MQHAETRERKGKKSPPPSNEKAKHGLGLFYIYTTQTRLGDCHPGCIFWGNIFYLGAASLLIGRTQSFDFYKKCAFVRKQ
jgi:hypothetical protein